MKRSLFRAAAVATIAFASTLPAQAASEPKPIMIKEIGELKAIQTTATVLAIDIKNRIVTLKGENGNEQTVAVSKDARNLDQVKVGDTVTITYYEAVAIEAKRTDATPSVTETIEGVRAEKGEKPSGVVLRRIHVVTSVLGTNADTQSVAVRGPLGHITQVKIRDPKVFAELKASPGGQIDLTYIEGMAIDVKAAAKKK
jgi:hypothetical protein